MLKTIYIPLLSLLVTGILSCSASAADSYDGIHPLQSDPFSFALGAFFPDVSGKFWKNSPDGDDGTDVDLHDDFGVDNSQTLPAFALTWRFSNKSRLQAEYFTFGQSNSHALDKEIDWGGLDFAVGATVKSNMDLGIIRAFYGFSFIKDDKKELGAGAGLHYLDIDVSLKGDATINGEPVLDVARGIDDGAILPNVGIYGNYALSPKWLLIGRVDWISANIDIYDGSFWNVEGAIQYQTFEHFGVGLSYRYIAFDIEVDDNGGWGMMDIDYTGPMLFFTANF